MTKEMKIEMTARLSGKNEETDFLELSDFLFMAEQEILERCYPFGRSETTRMPPRYGVLQCKIAAYMIAKQGAEGQTAHSENGVSRSYESGGIPESLLRQITPMGMVY